MGWHSTTLLGVLIVSWPKATAAKRPRVKKIDLNMANEKEDGDVVGYDEQA